MKRWENDFEYFSRQINDLKDENERLREALEEIFHAAVGNEQTVREIARRALNSGTQHG